MAYDKKVAREHHKRARTVQAQKRAFGPAQPPKGHYGARPETAAEEDSRISA